MNTNTKTSIKVPNDEEIRKELVSENGSVKVHAFINAIHNMGASHP